jgi:2-polyprenyl-3-methyl-5-hydroxy-6-metoxy-1,4-benzoquinol methylase
MMDEIKENSFRPSSQSADIGSTHAEEILVRLGPGRILYCGCVRPTLFAALRLHGCNVHVHGLENCPDGPMQTAQMELIGHVASRMTIDTIVVDRQLLACSSDIASLFVSLHAIRSRFLVVLPEVVALPVTAPNPSATTREGIEQAAIRAGYRHNPGSVDVADFERYNLAMQDRPMWFEVISDEVLANWPLERLAAERDLHMDMTRECGPRSDAHLVRYALAAEWIRPGDAVLDCACGLGYGTAILAAHSMGSSFLGVDIDAGSIAYAQENFAQYLIDYRLSSATKLDFIADRSVDMVVSFETLEHLDDYSAFLAEVARILRPGGRVVVSVPNLWIDETGRDPNPHHLHVFDFERCRDALARHFQIEARYAQSAPGGTKLIDAERQLRRLPLPGDESVTDTEWWIVVASNGPYDGGAVRSIRPSHIPPVARIPTGSIGEDDGDRTLPSDPFRHQFATDLIAAHLRNGMTRLVDRNEAAALESFRAGIDSAVCALCSCVAGNRLNARTVDFANLGEFGRLAAQCVLAVNALPYFRRSPGLFWRSVNAERLESLAGVWAAQDNYARCAANVTRLQIEVEHLKSELERQRANSTIRALLPVRVREVLLIILPRIFWRLLGRKR